MKYTIDETINTPAYMQLYIQLRDQITGGAYAFGAKLPSKRLLAEEAGVSVITVEHTYSILCDEGYIEARLRSGYFVIYRKDDFLSVNENVVPTLHTAHATTNHASEFPFSVLAKTMRKVLLDYGDAILTKSSNFGCLELRMALSAYLARNAGINARPQQIIIGSGAEYLYNLIIQLLGNKHIYAIENPSYEKIRKVYDACGVSYEMLKMGPEGIRSAELSRTMATVLHTTPFNSYPSHITASASKRNEYVRWATKRKGYIIEDNYDSELTISKKAEDTLYSLAPEGTVIYLNTFSQTIAPSIRVGYMVLPEGLLDIFKERLGFYSCTVPVFEQYVLAELIDSGDFERHINRVRRAKRKAKSGHIKNI